MAKYLWILMTCFLGACSNPKTPVSDTTNAVYLAQFNSPVIDKACQPLIGQYQEILKAMGSNDTIYLFNITRSLILLTDSLPKINREVDTILQQNFNNEVGALNGELKGLLAAASENDPIKEIQLSVNMVGIQLIHLLGKVGYKQQTVYIYSVNDEQAEDGFKWMSWQKTMRDPFHLNSRTMLTAEQVLQDQ